MPPTNLPSSSSLSARLAPLTSALLLLAASALGACSSVLGGSAGDAASCAQFTSCCTSLPGETAASCQATLEAAQDSAGGVTCASLVQTYQESGYCNGSDGGFATLLTGDGGSSANSSSCDFTGACDAGTSAPTAPGNGSTECQTIGTCANGGSFQSCVQTSASGQCTASVVLSSGAQFACVSCTDCASASATAQVFCNAGTPPVAGDAGVDSGSTCGTPPALHPETTPGVYCPFTATGAVHCAAGEQCCEVPEGTGQVSTCQAAGTTCPVAGSISWGCTDPIDCEASGAVCCATGVTTFDAVCQYDRGVSFTGSQCATACVPGQVQLCSVASDPCAGGQTCLPFKVDGLVLGTCL